MKKQMFFNTVMLVLLAIAISVTSVTYAWLVNGDTVKKIEYSIVKIDSSIVFYRAIDDNYNGVPNRLITPVTQSYYIEQYAFEQVGEEKFALSDSSSANMLTSLALENVLPTQRYTFKYALTNRSSAQNLITWRLQGGEYTDIALLSTLSFRLAVVESETTDSEGIPRFGEKLYLVDYIEGSAFTDCIIKAQENELYIEGMTGAQNEMNHLDMWLQIEMESYDVLTQREGFTLTYDQYNALQGATVALPAICIYFEITI